MWYSNEEDAMCRLSLRPPDSDMELWGLVDISSWKTEFVIQPPAGAQLGRARPWGRAAGGRRAHTGVGAPGASPIRCSHLPHLPSRAHRMAFVVATASLGVPTRQSHRKALNSASLTILTQIVWR